MRNIAIVAVAALLGCSDSEPADAAGQFSIALTNRDNGCELDNWVEGNTSSNIPFEIAQSGGSITGTIQGVAGGILEAWLGSRDYDGHISGNSLSLELFGSRSFSSGNCAFTYNSTITAELDGDVLTGTIDYTAATNGNPDCSSLEGCVSTQEFNGTRPPQ